MSPVIDAAVDAAFVLHDKGLERAEEQDADVVAKEEKYREHQKLCFRDHAEQIQDGPESVKAKPDEHHGPGSPVLLLYKFQQFVFRVVFHRLVGFFFGYIAC